MTGRPVDFSVSEGIRDLPQIERVLEIGLLILIAANVMAVVLESVSEIQESYSVLFRYFEMFSVVIFSVEYATRIVICVRELRYKEPIRGRIKYAMSFLAISKRKVNL